MPEGIRSVCSEDSPITPVTGPASGSKDGKPELGISEKVAFGPSHFILLIEDCCTDYRNSVFWCSVIPTHFGMELTDSSIERDVSELLVHVVIPSS